MTNAPSDERIRERFQRLRGETEERGAPDFRAMLDRAGKDAESPAPGPLLAARAPRRRVLWAGGLAGAAAAAALAAVLLTRDRAGDADAEFERLIASYASDAAAGAWRSPTDALLNVPGSGLTRALPSVGAGLEGAL